MLDRNQHDYKPHEADRLAAQIERVGSQVKVFGSTGSLWLLVVCLVILLGATLFGFRSVQRYMSGIQPLQSDASYQFTGRRSSATISGLNSVPSVNNTIPTVENGVSVCPRSLVGVSSTSLMVGQTATLTVPSTWRGGSFHVTNPSVLSVSGNVITALSAGTSQVYGNDFLVGTAFPCTADAVTVTVVGNPTPTPVVARFFDSHYQISPCGTRSATVVATSPVPGFITFGGLRQEFGPATGSTYSGPTSVALIRQGDGSYKGSLTVNTSHFGTSLAAIFNLTGYNGYAAVSNVACN